MQLSLCILVQLSLFTFSYHLLRRYCDCKSGEESRKTWSWKEKSLQMFWTDQSLLIKACHFEHQSRWSRVEDGVLLRSEKFLFDLCVDSIGRQRRVFHCTASSIWLFCTTVISHHHSNSVISLRAQTVLRGVVGLRYHWLVVLITRCHNSTQHSLNP